MVSALLKTEMENEKSKAIVPPQLHELSVCEACGGEFVCGAKSKCECWCGEVKLKDEARRFLSERYARCLCRECLERFARGG